MFLVLEVPGSQMKRPGVVPTQTGTLPESGSTIGDISLETRYVGTPVNTGAGLAETLAQMNEGLLAMKLIIKEMEIVIKKQPNVSRAIKDAIPKLEENLDRLQFLAKTRPKISRPEDGIAVVGLSNEGGKRSAASPPVADGLKSTKKVKSDSHALHSGSASCTSDKALVTQNAPSSEAAQAHTGMWTLVTRKKVSHVEEKSARQGAVPTTEKEKKKVVKRRRNRRSAKKREKPEAILLKPAKGKSYADVLSDVRRKVNPESCGVQVTSIRKTKAGELLVELKSPSTENRNAFQLALKEAAGETSLVKELVPTSKLEIRDLDDCTSTEEVKEGLLHVLGDYKGSLEISVLKSNDRGQRLAIASMETSAAKVLLQRGKVKIGWVNCRIRDRVDVLRCFRCLGYGHLGSACKGPDRSDMCFLCGTRGHRASDCKRQPICYLCIDKEENGRKHVAGSGVCGAFRVALEEAKRRK